MNIHYYKCNLFTYAHTLKHTLTRTLKHTHTHTHTYIYIYIYIRLCVGVSLCVCECLSVYVCIHVCVQSPRHFKRRRNAVKVPTNQSINSPIRFNEHPHIISLPTIFRVNCLSLIDMENKQIVLISKDVFIRDIGKISSIKQVQQDQKINRKYLICLQYAPCFFHVKKR